MSCLICDIVAGTEPASVVHADDTVVAFTDLFPVNPGHTLVVPRRHAVGLSDVDPDDGQRLFRVGQSIARAIRRTDLECSGVNLFLADGESAGQEVFHIHLHVIPRFDGDRFRLDSGQSTRPTPRAELDDVAARISAALTVDADDRR